MIAVSGPAALVLDAVTLSYAALICVSAGIALLSSAAFDADVLNGIIAAAVYDALQAIVSHMRNKHMITHLLGG